MSSRLQTSGTSSLLLSSDIHQIHDPLPPARRSPSAKVWVDPATLPNHHHSSSIAGNAPEYVKQLSYNTFMSYGVGEPDSFGYKVGRAVKFIEVNVSRKIERNERLEAVTVAEMEVAKREPSCFYLSHFTHASRYVKTCSMGLVCFMGAALHI